MYHDLFFGRCNKFTFEVKILCYAHYQINYKHVEITALPQLIDNLAKSHIINNEDEKEYYENGELEKKNILRKERDFMA